MTKFIPTLVFITCAIYSYGQVITPFSIRYQTTQKGGILFLSNTSVTCSGVGCGAAQAQNPPAGTGTDNSFSAAYADIDGDGTTFSSSLDNLSLPACSQISWAGLYWGGEITNAATNYATRNQCRIKANAGAYVNLTADALQDNAVGFTTYHCFKDVTSIVQAGGTTASFTVANVAVRVGGTNRFGGWTIVVVYKNDLQPMRNLTVFNGLSNVSSANANTDIAVSGFLTPLSGPVTFEVGAISYDGDRSSTGDQLLFNGGSGFVNISDAANPVNDIFNSTISYNGIVKTTPGINPGYTNTLGYDADIFIPNNVAKNYIGNSSTSATLRLTTANPGGETYLTQVVTMAIDVYEPDLRTTVTVEDINGGSVEPGDILEYTVLGKNIGSDPSINTFITDTLERNIEFVPGSIEIINGPNPGVKTDAAADDQAEYIAVNRVIKLRAGTGANASTGGTMNNSPLGTDYTEFKFRVVVNSDCIILTCDAVIDNRAYIFGQGNVSGNLFSNQSSPGGFDGLGCPIPGSTTNTIIHGCTVPAASSNSPACTGGTINLFATASTVATYSWTGPNSFISSIANPTLTNVTGAMAGTYTATISVAGISCTYTPSVLVTINSSTQTLAGIAGAGPSSQSHDITVASGVYSDGSCNLIDQLQPSGGNPAGGIINSKVWIESAVPIHAGMPYVARHYEVTPAVNPGTATGTLTLYFLQSEFSAFNSAVGSVLKLPTGPADAAGIANLRIGAYAGTSSNNTGLPASYSNSIGTINPDDAGIVWNAVAGRWEISFAAVGFGGFIVQTSVFVLPLTWVSFTAEKVNEKVLLKWQTATEINSSHFVIEYSINGTSFITISNVPAAGNSNSLVNYSYIHTSPQRGDNFYRLQQVDLDGRSSYSITNKVVLPAGIGTFIILTNPVSDGRLLVLFDKPATAIICNANGQVIKQQWADKGQQSINVSNMAQGIYLLRAGNETKKFIIK